MQSIIKIISINLLIVAGYTLLIQLLTHDDREGFAHFMFFVFAIAVHTLVNLIVTIVVAVRNNDRLMAYLTGLVVAFISGVIMYLLFG